MYRMGFQWKGFQGMYLLSSPCRGILGSLQAPEFKHSSASCVFAWLFEGCQIQIVNQLGQVGQRQK